MCDIKNGNVFLLDSDFGEAPKIFSSFERAESALLDEIRALDACTFSFEITCVQININNTRVTMYTGSVTIKDGFKYIIIKRDIKNTNKCKKIHREKIRTSLDY